MRRLGIVNRITTKSSRSATIAVEEILVGIGRAPNVEGLDLEAVDVGLYEREAEEKGIPVDSYTQSLEHVDRAILDGEEQGFVKVVAQKGWERGNRFS